MSPITYRKAALLFERVDNRGLRAGEWRRGVDGCVRVACPACGCVSELADAGVLWTCPSESCAVIAWLELLPASS